MARILPMHAPPSIGGGYPSLDLFYLLLAAWLAIGIAILATGISAILALTLFLNWLF